MMSRVLCTTWFASSIFLTPTVLALLYSVHGGLDHTTRLVCSIIPVHDVCLDVCIHVPIQRNHLPSPFLEYLTNRPSASEQLEYSHTICLYISIRMFGIIVLDLSRHPKYSKALFHVLTCISADSSYIYSTKESSAC